MNADELARMWLTNARDEMLARGRRAHDAYTKDPIRAAAQTLARAYYDASSVFEQALAALPSPLMPPVGIQEGGGGGDPLTVPTRCSTCNQSLIHRGLDYACPRCHPDTVAQWVARAEDDDLPPTEPPAKDPSP